MIKNDNSNLSDNPRISIYTEVGKYFKPNGTFDEIVFRSSIRKSLELIKEEYAINDDLSKKASEWLTAYLTQVIDYLHEKGIASSAFKLFQAAIEESTKMGIKEVVISVDHLQHIFSNIAASQHLKDDKKEASDEKKKKIFSSALQIFAKKGFYNATIDEIAALSGIGKGSVYRYFKSKKELLSELLTEKYKEIMESISKIFSKDNDVLQQIQEMIELWIDFIEKNPVVYRLIQNESVTQKTGEKFMFYDYFITHLPMFKERILSSNLEKRIKTTNFYTVFYGILGFIDGVAQKWFRHNMNYPLKDEIPVILEVLFNGFVGVKGYHKRFFETKE